MTRDEHRNACAEAMGTAILLRMTSTDPPKNGWPSLALGFEALDALHGIARVDPIEATWEMVDRVTKALYNAIPGSSECWPLSRTEKIARAAIAAAYASGDLTNGPEGKP